MRLRFSIHGGTAAVLLATVLVGASACSSAVESADRRSSADALPPDAAAGTDGSPPRGFPDGSLGNSPSPDGAASDAPAASETGARDGTVPDTTSADAQTPDSSALDVDSLDAGASDDASPDASADGPPQGPTDSGAPDASSPGDSSSVQDTSSVQDSGSIDTGSPGPAPGNDAGPTLSTLLPTGSLTLAASVQPAGPVYDWMCAGDGCMDPTEEVQISSSSVSPVSCTFNGMNPGVVTVTCTVTVAYPYASTCVEGDPGNCTWVVGLEPPWGPVSGVVAADGSFSLTFEMPYDQQDPVGAVLNGQLLPITGGTGTALAVSLMGYTGPTSWTNASGAAAVCGAGGGSGSASCPAVCAIGAVVYASGYANPTTACQSCQPAVDGTNWSSSPDGTTCGAGGEICSGGVCGAQCMVGGVTYAAGAANPNNSCQQCSPAASTSAWSSVTNGATCAGGGTCSAGACSGGRCTIQGTTYAAGAANPANACQSCQPTSSTTAWSDLAFGTVCGANAGNNEMLCEYGTCESVGPDDPNYCQGAPITAQQAQSFFTSGATTVTLARYQSLGAVDSCGPSDCSPWSVDNNAGPWLGVVPPSGPSVWLPAEGNIVLTLSPAGAVSLSLVSDPVTTFGGTLEATGYTQTFSPALGSGQTLVEQSFGGWPYSQLYFKDISGMGNQSGGVQATMTDHCLQVFVNSAQVDQTDAGDYALGAMVVFFATY
jgi:hypothetical protein